MEHENHVQSSSSETHTEPTSALDNIDIDAVYAELQCIPDDDPDKLNLLDDIGYLFLCWYNYLTDVVNLSKSVLAWEQAVRLTPENHPDKACHMMDLSLSFMHQFEHLSSVLDLEDALSLWARIVELFPDTHLDKPGYLNDFSVSILSCFEQFSDPKDIDMAFAALEHTWCTGSTPAEE